MKNISVGLVIIIVFILLIGALLFRQDRSQGGLFNRSQDTAGVTPVATEAPSVKTGDRQTDTDIQSVDNQMDSLDREINNLDQNLDQ